MLIRGLIVEISKRDNPFTLITDFINTKRKSRISLNLFNPLDFKLRKSLSYVK